ncbi:hypothetical protein [Lactiplantibacillus modestisalitolerans]|uniref:Uncharacterized protein n=1 Tax=Lactiplantibacillus modestisalitolerans TaxID=1457219 RepID=A0ABV5WWB8_9LACO|nr:hypothetical protein [Lactiplantibacillus modestisalitolerans]
MTLAEWYEQVYAQLPADGIRVVFKQPQADSQLPLVHVSVHTDLDVSSKTDTLNQVEQQIDVYAEGDTPPFDFEQYVQKVKWSLGKVLKWDSLTTQTMIDDSMGREIKRAMLLITITI